MNPHAHQGHAVIREATEWFSRLDVDPSEEEYRRFEAWRHTSPEHEQAFQSVSRMWTDPTFSAAVASLDPRAGCHTLLRKPQPSVKRRRYAAVAVLLFAVAVGLIKFDPLTELQADYRTSTGQTQAIQLPDQSTVTLNTNTAIATDYDGQTRRVRLLKGEAFFQVQPDPSRPFLVEGEGVTTRAVGTKFAVRDLKDDAVQVTVVEGTVESGAGSPASSVRLTPGQQARVMSDGSTTVHAVDAHDATAWLRGRLVVERTSFSDVIDEIRRYHQGYILIVNPAIAHVQVTGIYDLSNTTETLAVLAKTLPIQMIHVTNRLVILR